MKEQTYKEQKLAKDCYRCAYKTTLFDPNIIPQWYKKENGRLKEEIFVNKTVSIKVEQNNYPLSSSSRLSFTMLLTARSTAR